jgi:hypothetical protein
VEDGDDGQGDDGERGEAESGESEAEEMDMGEKVADDDMKDAEREKMISAVEDEEESKAELTTFTSPGLTNIVKFLVPANNFSNPLATPARFADRNNTISIRE